MLIFGHDAIEEKMAFHIVKHMLIKHRKLPKTFDFMRYLHKCFDMHKTDAVNIQVGQLNTIIIIVNTPVSPIQVQSSLML